MAKPLIIKSIRKEVEAYLQALADKALKEIEDVMSEVLIHALDNQRVYENKVWNKGFQSDERSAKIYEVKIGTRISRLNKWSKRMNKKLHKPPDDFAKDILSRFYGYELTLEKIAEDNEGASQLPLTVQSEDGNAPSKKAAPTFATKKGAERKKR